MSVNVLLVDDDDIFHMAIKRAFKKSEYASQKLALVSVLDGEEAINWLDDNVKEKSHLPIICFLDLNMPGMDGFQFLESIKDHQLYSDLRVYVLTTSNNSEDIKRCHAYGIAGYLVKSEQGGRYEKLMSLVESVTSNQLK